MEYRSELEWNSKIDKLVKNQKITSISLKESEEEDRRKDYLIITIENGYEIALCDDGQDCCEQLYMSADGDNFDYYIGSNLVEVNLKGSESKTDEDENCHDIQFLEVVTSKGAFTISSHNEHNGYYGGFDIECKISKISEDK